MADSKQYITQALENGSVQISEDVIAAIITRTVKEVEGVAGLDVKPGSDIAELIGKKYWGKGMKIAISQDNAMTVDCNITVQYGQSVVNAAKAVQDALCAALSSVAGVTALQINVNVCGIVRQ